MEKDSKVKKIDSDKELTKKRNRVLIILGVILVVFIIMKISKSIGFKDPFDDVDNLIQNSTSITSKRSFPGFSSLCLYPASTKILSPLFTSFSTSFIVTFAVPDTTIQCSLL